MEQQFYRLVQSGQFGKELDYAFAFSCVAEIKTGLRFRRPGCCAFDGLDLRHAVSLLAEG